MSIDKGNTNGQFDDMTTSPAVNGTQKNAKQNSNVQHSSNKGQTNEEQTPISRNGSRVDNAIGDQQNPALLINSQQRVPQSAGYNRAKGSAVSSLTPSHAFKPIPATPPDLGRMPRYRINRIIMRKRRHERYRDLAPKLVTVLAVILIAITSLFSGGAGAAYAYYNSQLPLLDGIAQHSLFQTTHIYDRNGKLLYELYDQQWDRGRRTYVNYNDISKDLIDATVAAEDHTFWSNTGVDYAGITRAALSNLQNGGVVQGGSTVTQQLIKKLLFDDNNRSLEVKGEEAILATGLTQQFPKWKIMEMYLNTVYYGNINYGVEAAAQDFFGIMPKCDQKGCKPAVSQLNLAQASLLAGLPQSPSYYDPTRNKPAALERQRLVLQGMVELGMITPKEALSAQKEMEKYQFKSYSTLRKQNRLAPHFVDYVIDQLKNVVGAQNLVSGGYNVYTTLDLDLQKKVEQIVYDHLYKARQDQYLGYLTLSKDLNVNNGAVVVMNPFNGEILAMNGSANYKGSSPQMRGQDNAALARRPPGSSFKPVVYATAFEMGWYPAMIIPDRKTVYPIPDPEPPKYYTPQNYDQKFHNSVPMTARTALGNSFNIPAVNAMMYAGTKNVENMAKRLGMTEVSNITVSAALGAKEVSLLHLTNAYATFANQGVRVPPTSILEITDNQGRPIYKYDEAKPKGVRAIGADTAFLISSMLSDKKARYLEFAPGNPLELDRPAAAKTGTTDSFRDNWTMGYTPHLTVGVWVGNSNNEEMRGVIGITGAGPIWHDVIDYASKRYNLPPDDFKRPKNVVPGTVSALTGLAPRPGEPTVTDWFIDGTLPTMYGNASYQLKCKGRDCRINDRTNNDNNNNNNN
jgi:membrane peptidoglycan carboxypeptidase